MGEMRYIIYLLFAIPAVVLMMVSFWNDNIGRGIFWILVIALINVIDDGLNGKDD